jgi:5-dehydro-4-deoxyglucarate dehydratase
VRTLQRLADSSPTLIGFKDGVGDIELMTRIFATLGDRFTYVGGLPTAETFALPYLELGVTTYSSALFNFVPEFALEFYAAVRRADREAVYERLRSFVLPYLEIRDREAGYAVSIVKAGLDAVGRTGGRVRPPLQDLTAADRDDLRHLTHALSPVTA